MKKITVKMLINARACFRRCRQFVEAYPKGIPVCWLCLKEANTKHGLPVAWLLQLVTVKHHAYTIFCQHYSTGCSKGVLVLKDKGLQYLEEKLLQSTPPKTDPGTYAYFERYLERVAREGDRDVYSAPREEFEADEMREARRR